jgi:hypothetical protein
MGAAATTPATPTARMEEDEPVPAHLLCPICWDTPPNHVYQCREGHLLCSGCLAELRNMCTELRQAPQCPTCRTELPTALNRNRTAEHSIALLPATCRHCTEKTTRGALLAHEASCPSARKETRRVYFLLHLLVVLLVVVVAALLGIKSNAGTGIALWPNGVNALKAALLGTTTIAQVCKNKGLLLAAECDNLAPLAVRLILVGADVEATRPSDGFTPLCIACKRGNLVMVQRLIAAGSRVNDAARSRVNDYTPLMLAAQNNWLDVVKLLIAAGADVNMARANGATPLHAAAQLGNAGIVDLLITAGANVNAARTDGVTALIIALVRDRSKRYPSNSYAVVVQKLRAAGAK